MCLCVGEKAWKKRKTSYMQERQKKKKKNFCSVTKLPLTTVDFYWIIKKENCHPVMFKADQTSRVSHTELEGD